MYFSSQFKKLLYSLFVVLLSAYNSLGQIYCGRETIAINCIVNNYKFVNDTLVSIIPDSCNYPILKDTIDGTWKFIRLDNSVFEIVTIFKGKINGWHNYYYENNLVKAYYYQNGKLKKVYEYYKNEILYSMSILKRVSGKKYIDTVDKVTYWDKEGNIVDREKAFAIWSKDYCE